MAADDKTEAPTAKRRKEMREEGNVARSAELGTAVSFLMAWVALRTFGEGTLGGMKDLMSFTFSNLGKGEMTNTALIHLGMTDAMLFGKLVLPFGALFMVAGLAINIAQVGFHAAPKAIRPQVSRINPFSGVKRLFSLRQWFELPKSLAKVGIVGFVAFKSLADHIDELTQLTGGDFRAGMALVGAIALELLMKIGIAFLVLALIDYGFQRWQFEKSAKMTKQEVREETRSQELNEQIRGRIRSLQRQMARKRMMQRVPQADVVITNPTHYAVALRYDSSKMAAPKVVAKGQRLMAQQIKDIARQCGIPLVENKPLAQALFRAVDVDQEIPRDLYKAVAEVLAFIYKLKNQRMAS